MFKKQLEINVITETKSIHNAVVTLKIGTRETVTAQHDDARQIYFFEGLQPRRYQMEVVAAGFQDHLQQVQVHRNSTQIVVVLESKNSRRSFTMQGNVRVPYSSDPSRIGIILHPEDEQNVDSSTEGLDSLLDRLGLVVEQDELEDAGMVLNSQRATDGLVARFESGGATESTENQLAALRESPRIIAAGPIFRKSGNAFAIFTNRLSVRFLPHVSRPQCEEILNARKLRLVQQLSFAPNLFLVEAPLSVGEEINELATALSELELVDYAEPQLAENPELDSVTPSDYLWPGIWDRQLAGVQNAWELLSEKFGNDYAYGHPGIVVCVVDEGVTSIAGEPVNADFQGVLSNNSKKVYKLFDFYRMRPDNDRPRGNHGVACAGVACAQANVSVAVASEAGSAPGAAPNSRLIGVRFPSGESEILNMYEWAAGLDAQSTHPNFPAQIVPGSDIITTSIGFGAGAPLSQAANDMINHIARRGRKGKGCMAFFSAGNANSNIITYRPYGWHPRAFSCAASTLDPDSKEIRASYSGWGDVEWCAPSNSGTSGIHNPPNSFATWTAIYRNDGNLSGSPLATTTLHSSASAGDSSIEVIPVHGLVEGITLIVGAPGSYGSESVTVAGAPSVVSGVMKVPVSRLLNWHASSTTIALGSELITTLSASAALGDTEISVNDVSSIQDGLALLIGRPGDSLDRREEVTVSGSVNPATLKVPVTPLRSSYAVGSELIVGNSHHRNNFGGTSSATPLCAGIAALVLSANPKLTWVEARQIMRDTAVKIDPTNSTSIAQWLDKSGGLSRLTGKPPFYSRGFGYGRLDAGAAVEAALKYNFSRDLMLRNTLADDGKTVTIDSIDDSPDIWVRNSPPENDLNAQPAKFEIAGPHQNPKAQQDCWIYTRISNRGTEPSLDAWVRFYVASYQGSEFEFPQDWEASNGSSTIDHAGTYFIGEIGLDSIDARDNLIVNIRWPSSLIPPKLNSNGDLWNPRILVEITPQDGPLEGTTVRENNNLAQKTVSIDRS